MVQFTEGGVAVSIPDSPRSFLKRLLIAHPPNSSKTWGDVLHTACGLLVLSYSF